MKSSISAPSFPLRFAIHPLGWLFLRACILSPWTGIHRISLQTCPIQISTLFYSQRSSRIQVRSATNPRKPRKRIGSIRHPSILDTIFALLCFLRENNEPLLTSSDFIRSSTLSQPISSLTHPARVALDRIYKHNLPDILDRKMGENMQDLKFLTLEINYGFNLSNEQVIDWRETELVVLAALITQNCRVEVLWHMRGALRAGWTREDVESVQKVAMAIAKRLAVRTDKVPGLEEISETSND
ncbi:uncharacterized protein UBRO_07132 [Ustilago bromivora]|uniref:Carboxymuconolactone decarboxylase-like domain-containing protein n=1 Tax=Ustilago bromivora TaxID=307758 RepID=A0A1K0HBQ5_9BASI|nr:uncharacterized protein UBRO_07132 [Ustilago bromivora]